MVHQHTADHRPAPTDDDLLTLRDAALIPNVHPATISRRVKNGDLPAYRLKGGHSLRVRRGDVLDLLVPVEVGTDSA